MNCSSCGHGNRAAAKFCEECGAVLVSRCSDCGTELRPAAKFCDGCGAKLGVPSRPATTPEEFRRVVTVVFADLAGSTALQERMDAESVRHLMGRFYEAMREVVEAAGGRVDKFIGDAVVAVFGVPVSKEDDAHRAVRAASNMVRSLESLNDDLERQWGVRLGMRTGVNTGEVVQSSDGFLVGDPMNVAARLEQAAQAGEVLVGEATWRIVRDSMTFEAVEPLALKGKRDPVAAYRLVSLQAPAADTFVAPFVGRDDELRRLCALFDEATRCNGARLATIVASPGLGKTRLAREVATELGSRARVLEARCDPSGSATFAPIAEALRVVAGIPETAQHDAVVDAFAKLLGSDESDADRVATAAASVLGVGEPVTPQETFWAVRRIFESLARTTPVLFIIDDVQWAEAMLLELVEHLAEWTRHAPMLLLALARPELREIRPALAETSGRAHAVVVLEGLDSRSTERLARDLLDAAELPAELVQRILQTTEGNPLFLRELVRMLVDDGVLHRSGDGWTVTVGPDDIDVPPTIHALLASRIERLHDDERTVVERASVIGHEFYRGAVADLVPTSVRSGIDGHLETLRRKELVEPDGTYWIDEPVHRFHHVLIRDAAYRRLLKEARAELHERFASWLETKVGTLVGEHEEVIGYHLERAHGYRRQLGPLDAHGQDLGRRAASHLAAAAGRALDRDDLAAAAGLAGRALELSDDPDVRIELLLNRCEALLSVGDVAHAEGAVDELSRLATNAARGQAWAECFRAHLSIYTEPERLDEIAGRAEAAAGRLAELGDVAGEAKAHAVHALALSRLGRVAPCEAALDRALACARQAGDRRRTNAVLAGAPLAALWGPSPVPRASGRCLDVVRVLRITAGAPAVEATALRCQAVLEALRGRTDAGRRMLDAARESLTELGLRHALLETAVFAGIIELLAGEASAAERELREAYDGFIALGIGVDAAYAAALLARACLALGRPDEAEALTLESERLGGNDLKTGIAWRTGRADALARRGQIDEALRFAREAVALAAATDALIDHAEARVALGLVLRAAGREDEGRAEIVRGAELFDRKEASAAADAAHELAGTIRRTTGPDIEVTVAGPRRRLVRPNLASQAMDRLAECLAAGDREGYAAAYAEEFRFVDHILHAESGRESFVDQFMRSFDIPTLRREAELLVSLGKYQALYRVDVAWDAVHLADVGDAAGAGERSVALVVQVDDDRKFVRAERFDPDDLTPALVRLGQLCAGNMREDADTTSALKVVDAIGMIQTTYNAGDFGDAWGSRVDPDCIVVDHRSGGWGTLNGREAMKEMLAGFRSLATDLRLQTKDVVALEPLRSLGEVHYHGTNAQGGPFEILMLAGVECDQTGRITRWDLFPSDEREEALAHFQSRSAPVRLVRPNLATAAWDRWAAAFEARDREAHADSISEDFVIEHHALHTSGGRAEVLELERGVMEIEGWRCDAELLATLGERHALYRCVISWQGLPEGSLPYAGSGELPSFELIRATSDGRICREEIFPPDDLDAALCRICELYADDELHGEDAAAMRAIADGMRRYVASYDAADWSAHRKCMADDVVMVDHRPGGWGQVRGRDKLTEMISALPELVGDRRRELTDVVAFEPGRSLTVARFGGTDTHGGAFEIPVLLGIEFSPDGLVARSDMFAPEQRAEAIAHFRSRPPVLSGPSAANDAPDVELQMTEALAVALKFADAVRRRDWARVESLVAPDAWWEDRRSVVGAPGRRGRDAVVTNLRAVTDLCEGLELTGSVIATRGDHLAVTLTRWTGDALDGGPFLTESLELFEVRDGRFVLNIAFNPNNMEAALAELDARYAAAGSP